MRATFEKASLHSRILSAWLVHIPVPCRSFYLELLSCHVWLLRNYHPIILSDGCHDLIWVTQFARAVKKGTRWF